MLVYLGTDLLAAWGLNLEFGVAGVVNFAYIVLVAAGAYLYAVFTLGPPAAMGGFQQYIIGARLPVAAAIALAALICGILGCLIGVTGLKRLRADYQAMVMLVISILATTIIGADTGLFNGNAGLSLIPNPLASVDPAHRGWYYVAVVGVVCAAGYLVLRRFTTGPLGRALRAVRDDEDAAIAVGKNVVGLRLAVQAVGGVYAGLSGALLAGFIGGWSPSAWEYVETLALLTAIIVGGLGNDAGVLLGVVIVPVLILQGVQFLPQIKSAPQLADELGWIILGLLTIAFVFARPQGLIPERRPRLGMPAAPVGAAALPIPPAEAGAASATPAKAGVLPELAQAEGPAQAAGPAGLAAIIAVRAGAPLTPAVLGDGGRAPILIVDGLVKRYGGVHAVDGASFTAAAGGITGLIGPNGAGKSTVLGLVSGFVRPDAGRITFDGRDVGRSARSPPCPARDRPHVPAATRVPRPDHHREPARRRPRPARRVGGRRGGRPVAVAPGRGRAGRGGPRTAAAVRDGRDGRSAGRAPERRPEALARGDAGPDGEATAAAARRADGRPRAGPGRAAGGGMPPAGRRRDVHPAGRARAGGGRAPVRNGGGHGPGQGHLRGADGRAADP